MSKKDNLTGIRFGNLIVLKFSHAEKGHSLFECQCDCGCILTVKGTILKRGGVKSCGQTKECPFAFKLYSNINSKHKISHTKEYFIFKAIMDRCYNKNNPQYRDYGGRGIQIYSEWINNPKAFYDYLQTLPEARKQFEARTGEKATLDRIDNNRGYEPGNLRWASYQEQNQNRRYMKLDLRLVKFILWENLVNNKSYIEIYEMLQSEISCNIECIRKVVNRESWSNISINKEILKYNALNL